MSNEPEIVGSCAVCNGDIYDYEQDECCDKMVHAGCKNNCLGCGHVGCKNCMVFDPELGWFCDTAGPGDCNLLASERLESSECRAEYNANN